MFDASEVLAGFDAYMWFCFLRLVFPDTVEREIALYSSLPANATHNRPKPASVAALERSVRFAELLKQTLRKMEADQWSDPDELETSLRLALEYHASIADTADPCTAVAVKYIEHKPQQSARRTLSDVTTEYRTIKFDSQVKCSKWLRYHFIATTLMRIESSTMTVLQVHPKNTLITLSSPSEVLLLQPHILYNLRVNVAWTVSDVLSKQ